MAMRRSCPALVVSAPASNQGKTTVTAALARLHASQGKVVRVFKTGPDFLDPMIHQRASGRCAYQLDLWMGGEDHCRALLSEGAADADLILIEGVMGLFDGTPSSADLAKLLGVPVLLVIDAESMAQSFGAIAHGLASYRADVPIYGVLANRVAGARHAELLQQGMRNDLAYLGAVMRDAGFELPDRHLGLVQAEELGDLDQRLTAVAAALRETGLTRLPAAVEFALPEGAPADRESLLKGLRIGVARDRAFSFLYPANLDLLRGQGAELVFFSPLSDPDLPEVDSVYLPGGYPELHLAQLSANRSLARALRRHVEAAKPLYAECGGMLYLLESLTDVDGQRAVMAGILPGSALLHARLMGLGYQSAHLPGGTLRGHTFHHSTLETSMTPWARGERLFNTTPGEAIFRDKRLIASYLHNYFPSNPRAAAQLFLP
jgi:cobyrinic acid a,c-diamide synthase